MNIILKPFRIHSIKKLHFRSYFFDQLFEHFFSIGAILVYVGENHAHSGLLATFSFLAYYLKKG